jgi:predicted site-specific integrase-resolvase
MPSKLPKAAAPSGRLIGYARVSTEEQGTDPQLDELLTAGCATVLEEHASGADRSRPVLARLLHEIRERTPRGGTRWHPSSVKHLLTRAERLGLAGTPPAQVDPRVWR